MASVFLEAGIKFRAYLQIFHSKGKIKFLLCDYSWQGTTEYNKDTTEMVEIPSDLRKLTRYSY